MQIKRNHVIKQNRILYLLLLSLMSFVRLHALYTTPLVLAQPTFTIMLDPAGDANSPGRILDDSFERGITWHFAENLKQVLEERYGAVRVILTRHPGEAVQQLQNANFANRLDIDLFLSINFYQETEPKPTLYLYTFSYGNDIIPKKSDLMFYRYDQAYLCNYERTQKWSALFKKALQSEPHAKLFSCKGIYKLPFKPLIGIKAPAFAFEAGLKTRDDWQQLIEPIAASLHPILEQGIQHAS